MAVFPEVAALAVFILVVLLVLLLVLKSVSIPLTLARFGVGQCKRHEAKRIIISYCWMPVLGVIAMKCCQSLSWSGIWRGIKGDDRIQPYGIVILFMSLAYIASALDSTGVFAYIALKMTYACKGNGRALFLFYFLLTSAMTTVTSNDVTIMTLTPIIIYFARASKVDPMPYLLAEYAAANILGMLLYIGNPTNIIVAEAYNMTFLGFTKVSALPCIACTITAYIIMRVWYAPSIPVRVQLPQVPARALLRDPWGAAVGASIMLSALGLLMSASSSGWEMWIICLACAGMHAMYNAWALVLQPALCERRAADSHAPTVQPCVDMKEAHEPGQLPSNTQLRPPAETHVTLDAACMGFYVSSATAAPAPAVQEPACVCTRMQSVNALNLGLQDESSIPAGIKEANDIDDDGTSKSAGTRDHHHPLQMQVDPAGENAAASSSGQAGMQHEPDAGRLQEVCVVQSHALREATSRRAGTSCGEADCRSAIPLSTPHAGIAPAPGSEYGSQRSVQDAQAMEVAEIGPKAATFMSLILNLPWEVVPFALGMFVLVEGLQAQGWVDKLGSALAEGSSDVPKAIMLIGWVSLGLANTINNQPMTILLTRVALSPSYATAIGSGRALEASLFALVIASNVGAVFTLIGALAGILWSNIMRERGVSISYWQFFVWMAPVGTLSLLAALLVLWAEYTSSAWYGKDA